MCHHSSCNRFLVVANVASSFAELEMICSVMCYIFNFKTKGDSFAFQHIPDFVHVLNMENVRMKHIDRWTLEQLPPYVDKLKIAGSIKLKRISVPNALRNLQIMHSNLRRIDIAPNSSLNHLSCLACDVTKVPLDIRNAPLLNMLKLYECKLSEIDLAVFCDNSHLTYLFLYFNTIRYIVNTSKRNCSFYNALSEIILSKNMLTTVNMELFNVFVNLKQVDLQMNRITTLSGRLVLRSFEILPLFTNQLGHIDLCGWDVPSVKKMFFTVNFLTTLPKCINNWTSVSHLDLSYNEFTNFSIESVAGMNNLVSIDLECNKLTEIMLNSVHFPPKLKEIRISRNYLTSLDLSFIPVRSLQVSVEYNLISSFDMNNSSPNLTRMHMKGNPIDCYWETRLEQLYGECTRNESFFILRDKEMKRCVNNRFIANY